MDAAHVAGTARSTRSTREPRAAGTECRGVRRFPAPDRVLILKPSSLGDVVQAIPVLRLIKQHAPGCQIDWWLENALGGLLQGDPDLHEIIPFDRKRWGRPAYWPEVFRSLRALRRRRYDWVIDLQALARSALVAWCAAGAITIGLQDHREAAPALYDYSIPRPSDQTHAVDWYLEVLRFLNVPVHGNFDWMPMRDAAAAAVEARWHPGNHSWIALQPGARWLNKRWPAGHFAALVRVAAARLPHHFAILGGADDRALGEIIRVAAPDRCLNLAGQTSLAESFEWLRRCDAVVTNDTGPMHAAAALNIPVIGLFGPTNPSRTGPYGQSSATLRRTDLPCVPCMKSICRHTEPMACLTGISAEQAFVELERRLNALAPRPDPS